MPSGARRLLLAGAVALLAACDDDAPQRTSEPSAAPVTTAEPEPTSPPTTRPARTTSDPARSSERSTELVVETTEVPATSTTSTTLVADDVACGPVVALADAVALAGGIDFELPWPDLRASLVASSATAAQSYRAVLAVAPPGVDDDLETLAAYNLAIGDAAASATSLTAFQAAVVAPDDALLDATAEVDRFMRATCSIGLTPD